MLKNQIYVTSFNHIDRVTKTEYSKISEARVALGIPLPKSDGEFSGQHIGITIAYPVNGIVSTKPKTTYQQLNPFQQWHFLTTQYIPQAIAPYVKCGICIPELTKAKNIHAHLYIYDDDIKDDLDLVTLQKDIGNSLIVRRLTKGKRKLEIVLNYIHFLKKDNWEEYMSKTLDITSERLGIYNIIPPFKQKIISPTNIERHAIRETKCEEKLPKKTKLPKIQLF